MEAMGAEGHWTSLSGVYTAEEADFMDLLLNNQIPNSGATLQNFWPSHDESSPTMMNSNFFSLELSNSNLCSSFSRGAASSSSSGHSGGYSVVNISQPMTTHSFDFFRAEDSKPAIHSFHDLQRRSDGGDRGSHIDRFPMVDQKIKLCSGNQDGESLEDNKRSSSDESSAKRARSFEKVEVEKKYGKSKKKPKLGPRSKSLVSLNGDHGNNNGLGPNGYCSSSTTYCSADESIDGGQAMSGGDDSSLSLSPKEPSNSDCKARARRGSATDPQSLYARKRRERINERLKVLQNLVPNGTKVDISTMLEEAVQYVTFLKLQIKLLSSDDLWMYAPIAYNGKDIGLDHNLKLRLGM